jgi:hypothetical protein
MRDIKTRPKTRDVKLRDTALLAPRELSHMMKDRAKEKLIHERPKTDADGGTSKNAAVNGIESEAQGAATYMVKQVYNGESAGTETV